jgi:hypothetical protein
MFRTLRHRLTYANVMSTLAVFIALGGSSYAAITIDGANIKNRSISGKKLRNNALTGRQVRESTLSRVPYARVADNAEQLAGLTAADFKIKCPLDTFAIADVCVERTPRTATAYSSAVLTCLSVGTPAGPGRRLPTHGELRAAVTAVDLAPGGELTSQVYPSTTSPGQLDVLYVNTKTGGAALVPDTAPAGDKAYRCVTDPLN